MRWRRRNSKVHVRTICAIKELFQIVRKINEYQLFNHWPERRDKKVKGK